ncbi:MAG: histidinol-phosphate transaminase [Clostridia bacterium]|nr:histidinol-phosphate transaminase [Clostridia bacterium]
MSRFRDSKFSLLKEYVPGEQPQDKKYIKLNTNESPFPPSPLVISSVNAEEVAKLNLYSDPECKILKKTVAERYGVETENVFLSNGSDEILNFAFMLYGNVNGTVFPDISYGFYKVFGDLYNIKYDAIPLTESFEINPEDYKNTNKFVVIANPNAPTGIALTLDVIEDIIRSNPDNVVLIDEAYVDFGAESALSLIDKYNNLIVCRTYSKSRSLAGARLGFAFASKELIADLELIRNSTNPYNINRLTQIAGTACIREDEYYMNACKEIEKVREYTRAELLKLGFEVLESKANFLFAKHNEIDGNELYLKLKGRGVLVRHFTSERICQFNRITIGTKDQMDIFLETVKSIMEEEK